MARDQELRVAVAARDRTRDQARDRPALRREPVADRAADLRVNGRIPHDAALAHAGAPGLELRLDEGDEACAGGGQRQRRRQDRPEPDEARVADDEVDRLGHLRPREVARVGPLQHPHARIAPEARRELAVADIDRVHPARPARQQHIGEAAGGGADIQRRAPARIDPEVRERVVEFLAAPRDPGMVRAAHREREIVRDLEAGLVEAAFAREHPAGQQQRLRPGPGLGQAARHEQGVEPLLGAGGGGRRVRRALRAAAQWRRSTM